MTELRLERSLRSHSSRWRSSPFPRLAISQSLNVINRPPLSAQRRSSLSYPSVISSRDETCLARSWRYAATKAACVGEQWWCRGEHGVKLPTAHLRFDTLIVDALNYISFTVTNKPFRSTIEIYSIGVSPQVCVNRLESTAIGEHSGNDVGISCLVNP